MMRAVLLLLILLFPLDVRAEDPEATRLLGEAERLFADEADYPAALRLFRQSYAIEPSAKALSGEALILEQQGQPILAMEAWEKLLAEFGPTLSEDRRQGVRRRLAALSDRIGLLVLRVQPAGAVVTVDDREVGVLSGEARVRVNPGQHTVVASLEGHQTQLQRIVVVAGERRQVSITLVAREVRVVERKPIGYQRRVPTWLPWATLGAGVVLAGTGGALHFLGHQDIEEFDRRVNDEAMEGQPAPDVDRGLLEAGERKQDIGIGLYVAGGAVALTGVVLWLINDPQPLYERRSGVRGFFAGRSAGVEVTF